MGLIKTLQSTIESIVEQAVQNYSMSLPICCLSALTATLYLNQVQMSKKGQRGLATNLVVTKTPRPTQPRYLSGIATSHNFST